MTQKFVSFVVLGLLFSVFTLASSPIEQSAELSHIEYRLYQEKLRRDCVSNKVLQIAEASFSQTNTTKKTLSLFEALKAVDTTSVWTDFLRTKEFQDSFSKFLKQKSGGRGLSIEDFLNKTQQHYAGKTPESKIFNEIYSDFLNFLPKQLNLIEIQSPKIKTLLSEIKSNDKVFSEILKDEFMRVSYLEKSELAQWKKGKNLKEKTEKLEVKNILNSPEFSILSEEEKQTAVQLFKKLGTDEKTIDYWKNQQGLKEILANPIIQSRIYNTAFGGKEKFLKRFDTLSKSEKLKYAYRAIDNFSGLLPQTRSEVEFLIEKLQKEYGIKNSDVARSFFSQWAHISETGNFDELANLLVSQWEYVSRSGVQSEYKDALVKGNRASLKNLFKKGVMGQAAREEACNMMLEVGVLSTKAAAAGIFSLGFWWTVSTGSEVALLGGLSYTTGCLVLSELFSTVSSSLITKIPKRTHLEETFLMNQERNSWN